MANFGKEKWNIHTFVTPDWQANMTFIAQPREEINMRGLFEVIIVDPVNGDVVKVGDFYRNLTIAKDETSAKINVLRIATLEGDIDDYDIIVRCLGDVRAKKETQEVVVVGRGRN